MLQSERVFLGWFNQKDIISIAGMKKFFVVKMDEGLPNLKGISLNLNQMKKTLPFDPNKEYDAIVLGGGTGGLSFTQEARELGLNVAVFNYVEPTPMHKFEWGLGGTWVNVGCIPKKLFHNWELVKGAIHMGKDYGWDVELKDEKVKLEVLRKNVQSYIKSLNFGYVAKLKEIWSDYINAKASISQSQTVDFTFDNKDYSLKAKNIVIATGGRPRYLPNKPGSNFKFEEEWITSDDLFSLEKNPGKILVVGGGYIGKFYIQFLAIEWAGFLKELGNEVIMINRSSFLRVFDQTIAGKIMNHMVGENLKALEKSNISNISRTEEGDLMVELLVVRKPKKAKVDSILQAIGRDLITSVIRNSGVKLNERSMNIQGRK
jgi:thioredoxin reductase (NADPH)